MFVEPPAAQTHEQAALFPVQQPRPLSSRRVAPVQRYGVWRPMKLVLEAELTRASRTRANGLPPEYLRASVRVPVSLYGAEAGTIIPAVMLGAVNSDLPGQILGQVPENVHDSETGEHLLIPQGTRLGGSTITASCTARSAS